MKGCSKDNPFREESDLFIALTICPGECVQDNGRNNSPTIEVCDPNEDDQKWIIKPYGDGKSIASTIKGSSGSCVASPENCESVDSRSNDIGVEMLPCDDPRTQMVWIDTSFQSWYCWITSQEQIVIDMDACGGNIPYWEDDAFYYNNVFSWISVKLRTYLQSVLGRKK
jgi:hypothetical protein